MPEGRELLAQRVVDGCQIIAAKLKDLEKDIRALWAEFDLLKTGDTIMGCKTKKEFCERHLCRTPRAIQQMLKRSEQCSRPSEGGDDEEPDVLEVVYEKVSAFVCGESASHPMQALPVLVDALTNGRTLTPEETQTLDAIVISLRQISDMTSEYHHKLTALRPMEMAA
jgi:hypothetical protein